MEELRSGHFWGGGHDLHGTAIGRVLWRRVRSDWRNEDASSAAPRGYETSYDVAHGYAEDRRIERP